MKMKVSNCDVRRPQCRGPMAALMAVLLRVVSCHRPAMLLSLPDASCCRSKCCQSAPLAQLKSAAGRLLQLGAAAVVAQLRCLGGASWRQLLAISCHWWPSAVCKLGMLAARVALVLNLRSVQRLLAGAAVSTVLLEGRRAYSKLPFCSMAATEKQKRLQDSGTQQLLPMLLVPTPEMKVEHSSERTVAEEKAGTFSLGGMLALPTAAALSERTAVERMLRKMLPTVLSEGLPFQSAVLLPAQTKAEAKAEPPRRRRVRAPPPDEGASQVLDWLYLGGEQAAKSESKLQQLGVSHVLNCCGHLPFASGKTLNKRLHLQDVRSECLVSQLPAAFAFLDEVRRHSGCCLVHCRFGASRSVSVVLAYLVMRDGWHLLDAWHHVRHCRPAARPNRGFVEQLIDLDSVFHGRASMMPIDFAQNARTPSSSAEVPRGQAQVLQTDKLL
mmetsp:Transcript_57223/g.102842  ORF Transcript_57223/g.102842 Transcript_57223/m.102842 type:complete len:442 (-) Transcript_57223:118-1443(-)